MEFDYDMKSGHAFDDYFFCDANVDPKATPRTRRVTITEIVDENVVDWDKMETSDEFREDELEDADEVFQVPILRTSVSAEKFSEKFTSFNNGNRVSLSKNS
jgi:hypothetical protein